MRLFIPVPLKRLAYATAVAGLAHLSIGAHAGYAQPKGANQNGTPVNLSTDTIPYSGATLTLTKVNGTISFGSRKTKTGADGSFLFTNVQPGTYSLTGPKPGTNADGTPSIIVVNFGKTNGLSVADTNANKGPTGPIPMNGTLHISMSNVAPLAGKLLR